MFLVVIAGITGFLPFKNNENTSENASQQEPAPQQTSDFCSGFSIDPGEISCEEARKIALESYLDPILSIDRKTITYGQRGVEGSQEKNIWLFILQPSDEQLEKVEVAVDRKTKEVLFTQPYFKE